MKTRLMIAALVAAGVLVPAGIAMAQDMPDVPGIGAARDQVADRPAAAQSPRVPASGVLPDATRAGLGRGAGSGSPSRLPETGVDTTALAMDGLTLLGAGTVLLAIRRRLAATS